MLPATMTHSQRLASSAASSSVTGAEVLRLDPSLDELIAPGTSIEKVAGNFTFVEGPMWRKGRLWFSDEEGDHVNALASEGQVTLLVDYKTGPLAAPNGAKTGPNGMATDKDGNVIMMQQYARAVVKLIERDGKVHPEPFFDSYEGQRLNSPNDVVFASDGSFYFTDPTYGLEQGNKDPAKEVPFNGVYHYAHGKLTPVVKDLDLPNGLALSPDEKVLYVNNSGPDQKIMRYDVQPGGSVANTHVLIAFTGHEGSGVPDGMKLDSRGNLWTTGPGGIRIITPEGKVLGLIKLPEIPANLAWGDDGPSVYITARTSIYRIRVRIQGNLPVFRR